MNKNKNTTYRNLCQEGFIGKDFLKETAERDRDGYVGIFPFYGKHAQFNYLEIYHLKSFINCDLSTNFLPIF